MPTNPLSLIQDEVAGGLNKHQQRMGDARVARDYYEMRNHLHLEARREEATEDFEARPKRYSYITRKAVEDLTDHLYSPGPTRRWEGSQAADEWLQQVYAEIRVNVVMGHADTLSTLGGVAAIEVVIEDDGELETYVYGADEFTVWTSFRDPLTPWAVCTKTCDPLTQQTEYRLWTSDTRYTYRTDKAVGRTAGGRVAWLEQTEPNPYGRLPFIFVPYEPPKDQFWCSCPGQALSAANYDLDRSLSDLAQAVKEHLCPIGLASNVDPRFRLHRRPGGFQVLAKDPQGLMGEGSAPKLEYLSATIDIEGAWFDAEATERHTLESLRIPPQRYRGDASATSGIALLVEDLPLIQRARKRRPHFAKIEHELAELLLLIGRWAAVAAPEAPGPGPLITSWAEPVPPLPDSRLQEIDRTNLELGLTSRVEILQQQRGWTREQALEHLARLADDRLQEARIDQGVTDDDD